LYRVLWVRTGCGLVVDEYLPIRPGRPDVKEVFRERMVVCPKIGHIRSVGAAFSKRASGLPPAYRGRQAEPQARATRLSPLKSRVKARPRPSGREWKG
ncbi:MAG: hypothetical protein ACXU9W_15930, partial [Thermodesulfobacteriota bacterium]